MQPIHTVYGGAHLFKATTPRRLGELAVEAMDDYDLGAALEVPPIVMDRVRRKLEIQPVEDYRVDFEDGFGIRSDAEEDDFAVRAAAETAIAMAQGTLPQNFGIRIKALSGPHRRRAERTLELFLATLMKRTGELPPSFVVTLPKITNPADIKALVSLFEVHEKKAGLKRGALKLEIMVESPRALFGLDGRLGLPGLILAAGGRCVATHFGTYDYTAALDITAAHQHMMHPACDLAKHLMQIAVAGTDVAVVDGATNILPIPRHRGEGLTPTQIRENVDVVHDAWRLHYRHIRHSLAGGFYQGWDLHPAQLPVRYAAVYSFFLEELEASTARLRNFIEQATRATRVGAVFDDAASAHGLLNFFLRGLQCGALTQTEATAAGVTMEELRSRSFLQILENRSN